jgi:hypothetical protein
MEDSTIKEIVALGCITVLEIAALASGINGVLFATSLAIIGGIAGYELKAMRG